MKITWIIPKKKRPFHLVPHLAWHPDFALASVWIRAYQIAPYLRELGYTTSINKLNSNPNLAIFLRKYDLEAVKAAEFLKRSGAKIITDVVANYFEERDDNGTTVGRATKTQVDNFKRLINLSDQVWTVSPYLQKVASKFHPSAKFISDSVDPAHFNRQYKKPKSKNDKLTFGWSGISIKAGYLDELSPIFIPLIASNKIKIMVISDKTPQLKMPFEFKRWKYGRFPQYIANCDLCIAPRKVTNNYDKGHSLFKIGVFMAMGVPAMAGPVPSYNLLLGDDTAGKICQTANQWESSISKFINNQFLKKEWSQHAVQKMKPFATPIIAEKIHTSIQEMFI